MQTYRMLSWFADFCSFIECARIQPLTGIKAEADRLKG